MRPIDLTKCCVYAYYGEEEMLPTNVAIVFGTDDPVELEQVLEERDDKANADTISYLRELGYTVAEQKAILVEDPYDSAMSHRLVEEDEDE